MGSKKRSLEGKDLSRQPKNPKREHNTISYVQILGTGLDTQDTSPSVLLFFDHHRFIFNAGEVTDSTNFEERGKSGLDLAQVAVFVKDHLGKELDFKRGPILKDLQSRPGLAEYVSYRPGLAVLCSGGMQHPNLRCLSTSTLTTVIFSVDIVLLAWQCGR